MLASTMFITGEGEVTAMLPISQRRKLSHCETRGCSAQMGEVLEKPTALQRPLAMVLSIILVTVQRPASCTFSLDFCLSPRAPPTSTWHQKLKAAGKDFVCFLHCFGA